MRIAAGRANYSPAQRAVLTALVLFLALSAVIAEPTLAQSATPAGPNTTTNGMNTTATVGDPIPTSCEEVRQNPNSQNLGSDYRVVTGRCSIDLSDGEVLSKVWFRAGGAAIDINANGGGWTIRNLAITNHGAYDDSPFNLRVDSRDGVGVVSNVWVSDAKSNVFFVHSSHAGIIRFDRVTFTRINEDGAYASRPGNPAKIYTEEGQGGIVGFNQAYVKTVGFGPEAGYGLRLGSDGSYIMNSTIVSTGGPAISNTFAGGKHPNQHPQAFDGVLFRNVDIVQESGDGSGIRLNNHQNDIAARRSWTSVTTLENVQIDAEQPIDRNDAGGTAPVVRGEYTTNADPSPPAGAPRSPERAASGVGGGTGSVGEPVGDGGAGGFIAVITQTVSILVVSVVVVIVGLAVVVILILERRL